MIRPDNDDIFTENKEANSAEWIIDVDERSVTCNGCGRSWDMDFEIRRQIVTHFKFCPECGRKMKRGV